MDTPIVLFGLGDCLRHPSRTIPVIDSSPRLPSGLLRTWAWLTLIVFAGSAWYGGSVAYAIGSTTGRGALWLIASTGLSWCVFGPLLIAVTRKRAIVCAHGCLVTMTYGIGVLAVGGIVNAILGHASGFPATTFNLAWVGLSNIVMATVLVRQFRSIGVRWWSTLTAWILGLDGTGAVMFHLFRHLLQGGM